MRSSALCLAVAAAAVIPTALYADTYARQSAIDAQHYIFRLTVLATNTAEIQGETTVRLRLTHETKEATLDLTTPTSDGKGMTVTAVTTGAEPIQFTHSENHLRLPIPQGARTGDDVSYTITYHGVPANGLRILDNIHGERTAFSENWFNQARQWLPTIDHIADKATGEFIITTRADYQVVANGALVEELDLPNGLRQTHYAQTTPISPWLYAVGIARFDVHHVAATHGVPLSFWVFPQDTEKGMAAFQREALGSFEFFSDRVGPFVYNKLAHVQAAGMGGGIENASNIFYGEKDVSKGAVPVVHETAHQWFGDAVTENDWNDCWLSEGFATYFTLLYTEHAQGRDAFVKGLRDSRETVLRVERKLLNTPVIHANFNESGTTGPNNPLVYQKGSWVLHMLRDQVGTDAFWRGIRAYYREHLNGVATSDDLRHAMEAASGQDLRWFFSQWLTRSGVPTIDGTWRYDAAAKAVVVKVRQTQTADPYQLSLGIGVDGSSQVTQMKITGREATISIPSDTEPAKVMLDPNTWLLAEFGSFSQQR
jgi:aminopeptidase N